MRFALLILIGSLVCLARSPASTAQLPVIRVATAPIDNGAELYYGKELGFFAKAGIDVEIEPIQSSSAITSAVASGAIDVGNATLVPLAVAREKSIPFVIIAPGAVWSAAAPNSAIVVPAGSPIRNARDLDGKTLVASGLGTLSEYAARSWIDQNGGDSSTVKFIELPASAMPAALASGRIDAAQISEPYFTVAKRNGRVLGYANNAVAKDFLIGAWFTTSAWATAHPELVKRFAGAVREAAAWANKNRAQSAAILVQYTKSDPAIVANMVRTRYAERLDPHEMQPEIDVAAKYGKIAPISAARLIYKPN